MANEIRARVKVTGRVQGVFFRAYTKEEAEKLNLTGWVKNLPTGEVEVLIEGEEEQVKALIDWFWKGPPYAKVSQVSVSFESYRGDFKKFSIIF